jgi:hypothetical protein
LDILIGKPPKVRGYALHRLVAQYQHGKPALWADEGKQVRIRPCDGTPPSFEVGKIFGFTVKACVAYSSGNRHVYLPLADWRGRREWLQKRAAKYGFDLVGVHVSGAMEEVQTHDGRNFTIDATEFTGLLKILDADAFNHCYMSGLGKVGKSFGLNMIVIE